MKIVDFDAYGSLNDGFYRVLQIQITQFMNIYVYNETPIRVKMNLPEGLLYSPIWHIFSP